MVSGPLRLREQIEKLHEQIERNRHGSLRLDSSFRVFRLDILALSPAALNLLNG